VQAFFALVSSIVQQLASMDWPYQSALGPIHHGVYVINLSELYELAVLIFPANCRNWLTLCEFEPSTVGSLPGIQVFICVSIPLVGIVAHACGLGNFETFTIDDREGTRAHHSIAKVLRKAFLFPTICSPNQ